MNLDFRENCIDTRRGCLKETAARQNKRDHSRRNEKKLCYSAQTQLVGKPFRLFDKLFHLHRSFFSRCMSVLCLLVCAANFDFLLKVQHIVQSSLTSKSIKVGL